MAGQGMLFKALATCGGFRKILSTNRLPLISFRPIASEETTGEQKLKDAKTATVGTTNRPLPLKPKKPLTPFFLYMADHRNAVKAANPGLRPEHIVLKLSEQWRNTDDALKEKYRQQRQVNIDEFRKKELEYYEKLTEEDKAAIKSASIEKSNIKREKKFKQALRDSKKPKGIRTSYAYFLQDKMKGTSQKLSEVVTQYHDLWATLGEDERKKYVDLYLDDKKRYDLEMDAWEEKMIKEGKINLIRHRTLLENRQTRARKILPKSSVNLITGATSDEEGGALKKQTSKEPVEEISPVRNIRHTKK